ncbi:LCP family protein [Corynebacterium macginleyi]|uniref:LCP family protein n=1 Tax=Corynebacterium macginleyi TaxID=38290 RepID=UPI00190CD65E|nr:LCP family protein [Corynebacterium macginleyi]MBK4137943.1 LytR family transcriptional regulator [Corynebacterium macginleyi]MBK4146653.1 LytR family transcriptional regulator [Corynebacterium macginleyi]MBK4148710.1 LytR family transcriptional regulator [Corynebacterium macginleyi]MBK4159514.1 LytR family transcriptional regulator [Corynebacterium macginleyi]MBK4178045.1 LytR family transcriptional regulator [Corynebacterium macginleyi]
MTESGRDPHREASRAGNSSSSEFVRGADGRPLKDRYGRPIRRRPRTNRSEPQQHIPRQETPSRYPSQYRAQQHSAQQPPQRAAQRPQQSQPQSLQQLQQRYQPQQSQQPPRRHSKPHRRRKKTNPIKQFGGCAGVFILFVVVCSLLFALWADTRLNRVDALPDEQVANTSGTNWLLVGSDSRQGLSEEDQQALNTGGDVGEGRTDTIMLLHIPRSGQAQLVSIPRDSYVEVPGFGMDKINAAFAYGGPKLLTQTVEGNTGLRIDHYAEIGMGGLANVVDSVGGVDICVTEPINDPLAGIDLQEGCQKLEGSDALGYVRTRATAMGDLDRVQRQREFFAALLDKITSPATIVNPFRSISLINHTASSFIVDEGDHVWHLARVALAMGSGVATETVPVGGFQDTVVGNVVLWDEQGAQQLWDSMK